MAVGDAMAVRIQVSQIPSATPCQCMAHLEMSQTPCVVEPLVLSEVEPLVDIEARRSFRGRFTLLECGFLLVTTQRECAHRVCREQTQLRESLEKTGEHESTIMRA